MTSLAPPLPGGPAGPGPAVSTGPSAEELFGAGPVETLLPTGPVAGSVDLDTAMGAFRRLAVEDGPVLRLGVCRPTAAFSRRDVLLDGYAAAVDSVVVQGFEPVVRPVGGRLAAYDEGSLVVHLLAGHPEARLGIHRRFELVGSALAAALTSLGMTDVRVGSVPGEYCEGEWSVNRSGQHKLAGTGQRISKRGYLFSAVITVTRPEPLRAMLTDAYDALGLDFDPASVGSVDRWVPGVTVADVAQVVEDELTALFATQATPGRPARGQPR